MLEKTGFGVAKESILVRTLGLLKVDHACTSSLPQGADSSVDLRDLSGVRLAEADPASLYERLVHGLPALGLLLLSATQCSFGFS